MSARILIIDDEPDVVTYLAAVLKSNAMTPFSTTNPNRALKMAAEIRPDLICLDIMMPEKSGISIYTRLKKDPSLAAIPVVIISGVSQAGEFDFRSYVSDKSVPPPDGYLEKPIVIDQYLQLIQKLISSKVSPAQRKASDA
jgi:CheY-like chemotaxis protein